MDAVGEHRHELVLRLARDGEARGSRDDEADEYLLVEELVLEGIEGRSRIVPDSRR
jgi:hypothetical protein